MSTTDVARFKARRAGAAPPASPARTAVATDDRRCDRCTAAGVRRSHDRTRCPFWDPAYRLCRACALAVARLLDDTDTWPRPSGDGGFRFPSSPAHTGAPHFLWRAEKQGYAAQLGTRGAA